MTRTLCIGVAGGTGSGKTTVSEAIVSRVGSDRIAVMYLGKIVEFAPSKVLYKRPLHPYTRLLLDTLPDLSMSGKILTPMAGEVPNPMNPPPGCVFHPRCPMAEDRCKTEVPALHELKTDTWVSCHLAS